jgi:hypothetical protein
VNRDEGRVGKHRALRTQRIFIHQRLFDDNTWSLANNKQSDERLTTTSTTVRHYSPPGGIVWLLGLKLGFSFSAGPACPSRLQHAFGQQWPRYRNHKYRTRRQPQGQLLQYQGPLAWNFPAILFLLLMQYSLHRTRHDACTFCPR